MPVVTFRGHRVPTTFAGADLPELKNWPRDHTFVSADNGETWGCFGRDLKDVPTAPVVCEGRGLLEWAKEIGGEDGRSKITFKVTGICQQACNRLLLPAGIDVADSFGNEIATVLFGKYGLDVQDFIKHVKDAAHRVNARTPGSVSDAAVAAAVKRVTRQRDDELATLAEDIEEIYKIRIPDIPPNILAGLKDIYLRFAEKRSSTYANLKAGRLNAAQYAATVRRNLETALNEVKDLVGDEQFRKLFPMPPRVAAATAFGDPVPLNA